MRPQLNTIVEVKSPNLKILFSHENRRLHSTLVPILKQYLSHELGREVEVISRFNAWDTLYTATDNVFDLVILAESYPTFELTSEELVLKIKRLDPTIPVVQFSSREETPPGQLDGALAFPKSRTELRPLTHFFRNRRRESKKS